MTATNETVVISACPTCGACAQVIGGGTVSYRHVAYRPNTQALSALADIWARAAGRRDEFGRISDAAIFRRCESELRAVIAEQTP